MILSDVSTKQFGDVRTNQKLVVLHFLNEGHGLGEYIFGLRIIRNHSKKTLALSQENYIHKGM